MTDILNYNFNDLRQTITGEWVPVEIIENFVFEPPLESEYEYSEIPEKWVVYKLKEIPYVIENSIYTIYVNLDECKFINFHDGTGFIKTESRTLNYSTKYPELTDYNSFYLNSKTGEIAFRSNVYIKRNQNDYISVTVKYYGVGTYIRPSLLGEIANLVGSVSRKYIKSNNKPTYIDAGENEPGTFWEYISYDDASNIIKSEMYVLRYKDYNNLLNSIWAPISGYIYEKNDKLLLDVSNSFSIRIDNTSIIKLEKNNGLVDLYLYTSNCNKQGLLFIDNSSKLYSVDLENLNFIEAFTNNILQILSSICVEPINVIREGNSLKLIHSNSIGYRHLPPGGNNNEVLSVGVIAGNERYYYWKKIYDLGSLVSPFTINKFIKHTGYFANEPAFEWVNINEVPNNGNSGDILVKTNTSYEWKNLSKNLVPECTENNKVLYSYYDQTFNDVLYKWTSIIDILPPAHENQVLSYNENGLNFRYIKELPITPYRYKILLSVPSTLDDNAYAGIWGDLVGTNGVTISSDSSTDKLFMGLDSSIFNIYDETFWIFSNAVVFAPQHTSVDLKLYYDVSTETHNIETTGKIYINATDLLLSSYSLYRSGILYYDRVTKRVTPKTAEEIGINFYIDISGNAIATFLQEMCEDPIRIIYENGQYKLIHLNTEGYKHIPAGGSINHVLYIQDIQSNNKIYGWKRIIDLIEITNYNTIGKFLKHTGYSNNIPTFEWVDVTGVGGSFELPPNAEINDILCIVDITNSQPVLGYKKLLNLLPSGLNNQVLFRTSSGLQFRYIKQLPVTSTPYNLLLSTSSSENSDTTAGRWYGIKGENGIVYAISASDITFSIDTSIMNLSTSSVEIKPSTEIRFKISNNTFYTRTSSFNNETVYDFSSNLSLKFNTDRTFYIKSGGLIYTPDNNNKITVSYSSSTKTFNVKFDLTGLVEVGSRLTLKTGSIIYQHPSYVNNSLELTAISSNEYVLSINKQFKISSDETTTLSQKKLLFLNFNQYNCSFYTDNSGIAISSPYAISIYPKGLNLYLTSTDRVNFFFDNNKRMEIYQSGSSAAILSSSLLISSPFLTINSGLLSITTDNTGALRIISSSGVSYIESYNNVQGLKIVSSNISFCHSSDSNTSLLNINRLGAGGDFTSLLTFPNKMLILGFSNDATSFDTSNVHILFNSTFKRLALTSRDLRWRGIADSSTVFLSLFNDGFSTFLDTTPNISRKISTLSINSSIKISNDSTFLSGGEPPITGPEYFRMFIQRMSYSVFARNYYRYEDITCRDELNAMAFTLYNSLTIDRSNFYGATFKISHNTSSLIYELPTGKLYLYNRYGGSKVSYISKFITSYTAGRTATDAYFNDIDRTNIPVSVTDLGSTAPGLGLYVSSFTITDYTSNQFSLRNPKINCIGGITPYNIVLTIIDGTSLPINSAAGFMTNDKLIRLHQEKIIDMSTDRTFYRDSSLKYGNLYLYEPTDGTMFLRIHRDGTTFQLGPFNRL